MENLFQFFSWYIRHNLKLASTWFDHLVWIDRNRIAQFQPGKSETPISLNLFVEFNESNTGRNLILHCGTNVIPIALLLYENYTGVTRWVWIPTGEQGQRPYRVKRMISWQITELVIVETETNEEPTWSRQKHENCSCLPYASQDAGRKKIALHPLSVLGTSPFLFGFRSLNSDQRTVQCFGSRIRFRVPRDGSDWDK